MNGKQDTTLRKLTAEHTDKYATRDEVVKVLRKLTKGELIDLLFNRIFAFRRSDLRAIERDQIMNEIGKHEAKAQTLWDDARAHAEDGNFGLSRQVQQESDRHWRQANQLHKRFMEMLS